jgi:hypothetical protein
MPVFFCLRVVTVVLLVLTGSAVRAGEAASPAAAVLDRHLAAFASRDVDAIMADYSEDAVFITPQGVFEGRAEIRGLFEGFVEEFSSPQAVLTVIERHSAGPVAHITWSGETPAHSYRFATDTLYVEGDLIRYQTFAAVVEPK